MSTMGVRPILKVNDGTIAAMMTTQGHRREMSITSVPSTRS